MGPSAREVKLSSSASRALDRLDRSGSTRSISRRVRDLKPILLADCLHGGVVRKRFIPRELRDEYGIENLCVGDLPEFWRLLYSIVHEGTDRFIVILEIVDHRRYDHWFPGRGR